MKNGIFKPILLILLSLFLLISVCIRAAQFTTHIFDTKTLKQAMSIAISNLELKANIDNYNMLSYYQEITAEIHLSVASIIGNKVKSPAFYGIGSYFIAKHFRKYKLAQKILLEERRYTKSIIVKSWIDGELLTYEKIKLLKNVNNPRIIPALYNRNSHKSTFEIFERLTQKANSILYSEKLEHDKFRNYVRASEILRDEAEQLASDGNLQGSVLKLDTAARLLISYPKSNSVGPRIMTARSITDLGLPFQALVRYKQLLLQYRDKKSTIWHAIILEDMGDLYTQMNFKLKAIKTYSSALAIEINASKTNLRLNNKLNLLRE